MVKAVEAMDLPETFLMSAHSYGGYLSCLYASHKPHRIESLFLLSPVATEADDPDDYQPLAYND